MVSRLVIGKSWLGAKAPDTLMSFIATKLTLVRAWRPDQQFRTLGWFGIAEGVVRVSRLVTIIVLARFVAAADVGTAALALMAFELVRTIGVAGLGQMIVRAPDQELRATCDAVWKASWIATVGMVVALAVLGFALSSQSAAQNWWGLIACLAAVYLLSPFGLIQQFLLMRADRLRVIAGVSAIVVIVDCLLTAVLAFMGFGAFAILAPKLIVAPLWIVGMRLKAPALPPAIAPALPLSAVWRFVVPVMGTEALAACRQNADKFLVGMVLGPAALGVYFFAYNSGVGLSMTLTTALTTTVYPHLSEVATRPLAVLERADRLIRRHGMAIAGLIALQAAAIPFYVPLLLGPAWSRVPLLAALLCVAAITKPAFDIASQALRAVGATHFEFAGSLLFTIVCLGSFYAGLHGGLQLGVVTLAVVTFLGQIAFACAARAALKSKTEHRVPLRVGPLQSPA